MASMDIETDDAPDTEDSFNTTREEITPGFMMVCGQRRVALL